MRRFALEESGRLALGLFGALLLAAVISALSLPGAGEGAQAFAVAAAHRLLAFAKADFGVSTISGLGALQELAARGPTTLNLVLLGAGVALALGIPLGLLSSTVSLRNVFAPLGQFVSAAPVFCAALALAYAANRLLGWSPSEGTPIPRLPHDFTGWLAILPPVLTVGLAGTAAVQIALRRAAAEIEDAPFRAGLGRLGLPALEIDRVYVLPQVLAGLLRSLGEVVLALLSAAVVAEWVFKCPGAADLFVKSVALRDWNMVALILFLFAAAVLLADFAGRIAAYITARAPT
jgi:ABC-type dipeptide/oligopeptide/nickel transport system permease component